MQLFVLPVTMYETGEGVQRNYRTAIAWQTVRRQKVTRAKNGGEKFGKGDL